MEITSGKIAGAQKVVLYGAEGIGKSTFAAQFPAPLFIDTEGSTSHMSVRRLPRPESWEMLLQEIEWVRTHPAEAQCATLVIDTADWAENLCMRHLCAQNKWASIETPGYGKGYVVLMEEFGRMLNVLQMLIESGVNVVLTAHAMMRKFEQPDELGAYDRWELKLQKKTSPLVKEWADMLLFANYKTIVVKSDNKNKAQGGQRMMYTSHHPAWDAKNRHGLPDEVPFTFDSIRAHIVGGTENAFARGEPAPEHPSAPEPQKAPEPEPAPSPALIPQETPQAAQRPDGVPDALWQLMQTHNVTEEEIRMAVSKRGYFPYDTPIEVYGTDFINGVLIGAWPQIHAFILANKDEMPF